jgi:exodeoxyribonuclease-3
MRIATWNVNSLRARLDRVIAFLQRAEVDVLALQETKVDDARFPYERFTEAGYQVARHGLSQWNGVALASRVGLEAVQTGWPERPGFGDPPVQEARALGATCAGVTVWSLYVPNGRAIDDPHYQYKLAWLATLRDHAAAQLAADPDARIVLCGDFNIAPTDEDVWDIEFFTGATHVTEPERAAFTALVDAGYADVVRPHHPGPGVYTYWDYQQLRFPRREGMRIDFLLASPALARGVTGAHIDRDERKGKGASDHAPVIIDTADEAPVLPIPDGLAVVDVDGATTTVRGLW